LPVKSHRDAISTLFTLLLITILIIVAAFV